MNISFKTYDKLPDEAKEIRTTVFVLEQGFVDEFDESDDKSIHVVMFDNNNITISIKMYFQNNLYINF